MSDRQTGTVKGSTTPRASASSPRKAARTFRPLPLDPGHRFSPCRKARRSPSGRAGARRARAQADEEVPVIRLAPRAKSPAPAGSCLSARGRKPFAPRLAILCTRSPFSTAPAMPRAQTSAAVLLRRAARRLRPWRAPPAQDAAIRRPRAALRSRWRTVETPPNYIIGIRLSSRRRSIRAGARAAGLCRCRPRRVDAGGRRARQKFTAPYDSAWFTGLVDTPGIVAVAADGSSYTGGAHGN